MCSSLERFAVEITRVIRHQLKMNGGGKMFMKNYIKVVISFVLALSAGTAHAVLERVGPASTAPSIGGFPVWYQDTTGLSLEFCDPRTQSEVDGGWCLLLPGDVATIPEVFPTSFFDEHFYFAATAAVPTATGSKALLVLAEESAFAIGPPVPGDQVTFSRIRMVLNPVPATGTYRFIHPYGEDSIQAQAGDRIFYTDDVGINCAAGQFDCALNSRLGPFLLPSDTPGGAEMPPLTAANPTPDTNPAHFGGVFAATAYPGTGKAYIADPSRIGPVTGSPLPDFTDSSGALRNHNIFRIEGPAGSALGIDPVTGASVDYVETSDFNLMGRVFTGSMPGRVNVDRASYTRNVSGQKLDVFATAVETIQGRVPGQPRPAPIAPQLTFYDAPCAGITDPATGEIKPPFSAPIGATEVQMFAIAPGIHSGQVGPAALPAAVCLKDSAARDAVGNIVPAFIQEPVTDEVSISQAFYDSAAGTLTVAASSSDETVLPTLSLAFGTFRGDLVNGQIVVSNMIATPASVKVLSSAHGANQAQVITSFASTAPPTIPVAANDSFTFLEDSGVQILSVLANDSNVAGGTVSLSSAPRLGAAAVNPDGTVSYTPNLNASGTDQFTYTVTVGTTVTNVATASLNITPVNDPPTAVNDSANAIVNTPVQINVLSNDLDPDGAADLVTIANLTQPLPVGATISFTGGIVTFSAASGGSYTFTYQAQDVAGTISANTATVTVQVAAAEALNIAKNEYVRSKSQLRAQGTVTPAAGQRITLEFVNSAGTVLGQAGTATADGVGNWQVQAIVALPSGASALKVTTSNGTVRTAALVLK